MILSIIVAQSKNRVIGIKNKLPWHLPQDLRYFRQITLGKPVIMGRLTYESIGRPLPQRTNIVISRQKDYQPAGIQVVSSLEQAVKLAENQCLIDGSNEALIIGGEQIYAQSLARADRLYLTEVDACIEGDAWFPAIAETEWLEKERQEFSADDQNPYDYSFILMERQ